MGVYKFSAPGTLTTGRTLYTSMLAGNPTFVDFAPSGAYDSIATATVSGTSTENIVFSSIPSTYKHLQLRVFGRTLASTTVSSHSCRMTGVNGNIHYVAGDGSSAFTDYNGPIAYPYNFNLPGANATANVFGTAIIDILDYASTDKFKVFRVLNGFDANGSGVARLNSSLFQTTDAVTSLTISIYQGGANWAPNSTIGLYGIKG